MFAPINKLPPEILTHICTFASDAIPSDFAHLCAQVCRTWRNTLLASPSLWNEIHSHYPLHINVHLTQSGTVPLDMYIFEASTATEILSKVAPHFGRVRLLYLSIIDEDGGIFDWFRAPKMLLLRTLHIDRTFRISSLSASIMEKISSSGVNITELFLWNFDTHLSSLTFPHLLSFGLVTEDGFEGPRVSDMIGFLRGHPTLEELDLYRVNYSDEDEDDAGSHIEPIAFRHLKDVQLGGRLSSPSPDSLPHIEANLLSYLSFPPLGQCEVWVRLVNTGFPSGTNYLLTLIRAWEIISSPGGGFGGGSGFSQARLSIDEGPNTLTGQVEFWITGWGSLCVGPETLVVDSRSWVTPDWETTTDEDPGAGEAGNDEFQAQLSRLGCYLDPLRWSPSPLATVGFLRLCGFGYTTNKEKYLQYLRECFVGLNRVRDFHVEKTNSGMVVHLLQPFKGESGEMVVLFPLLWGLAFYGCTPMEPHRPGFLEVMKERAARGNVLEVWVDDKKVDLPELSEVQETT